MGTGGHFLGLGDYDAIGDLHAEDDLGRKLNRLSRHQLFLAH